MDSERKRHAEAVGRHFRRALLASMAFVALIGAIFYATPALGGLRAFALVPLEASGLVGILTAPLLHGSAGHWLANASALLVLGTLVGTVYPRAALRALPVLWLLSGLVTWLIGRPSFHIGASGLTHGLMFLLLFLGLFRRDRASVAAALIAFFFYGGMLLTVLPREPGVSWEYHLGGALAGIVAAVLGVIKAMSKINESPEVLGGLIGAALVGTMLGIFLSYCLCNPIIAQIKMVRTKQHRLYIIVKQTLLAYMNGSVPQVALEYGRKTISSYERPSIDAVEQEMMNPGGGGESKAA